MNNFTIHRGKICVPSTDFIWGANIDLSVCDGMLDFYQNQTCLEMQEGVTYSVDGYPQVNHDIKQSTDLCIPNGISDKRVTNYLMELQKVLNGYMDKFPFCYYSEFRIIEAFNIQYYPPGGGFKTWHTERSCANIPNVQRHLVFMTYLNDVPNGGTEWFHQDKYVEAKKGFTVIWPADWTHTHRGRVSEDYDKYIVTGWFSYG